MIQINRESVYLLFLVRFFCLISNIISENDFNIYTFVVTSPSFGLMNFCDENLYKYVCAELIRIPFGDGSEIKRSKNLAEARREIFIVYNVRILSHFVDVSPSILGEKG